VTPFLGGALFFAGLLLVLLGLWRFRQWLRRRGLGSAVIAPIDDIFYPSRHETHFEIESQRERRPPMARPDPPQ
jgi:hypothetical protein